MTWWHNDNDFDKDLEIDVDVEIDIDTDIDFDKDFDADINVTSNTHVDGNSTSVLFDAEALGEDTVVEADIIVLTIEDELSSATGSIIAATG